MDELASAFADERAEDPERLDLPAGTVIHPDECGFALPDGRYLRVYEYGVREEHPDGRAASGQSHVARPQLFAHRCRVGGNPHSFGGPTNDVSYTTATNVHVILPETLAAMDDDGLIEFAHLLMNQIVMLEMKFDMQDGDVLAASLETDEPIAHVIDLSTVGPYGGLPLP
jgi:hypothetical protein